jgi:hypothetical protein
LTPGGRIYAQDDAFHGSRRTVGCFCFVVLCIRRLYPKGGPGGGPGDPLFPSLPSVSADGQSWSLTVQGRIFEPAAGSIGRTELIEAISKAADLDGDEAKSALFHERAGYFLSDSEKNRHVSVRIGEQTFSLPASDKAGLFTAQIH